MSDRVNPGVVFVYSFVTFKTRGPSWSSSTLPTSSSSGGVPGTLVDTAVCPVVLGPSLLEVGALVAKPALEYVLFSFGYPCAVSPPGEYAGAGLCVEVEVGGEGARCTGC